MTINSIIAIILLYCIAILNYCGQLIIVGQLLTISQWYNLGVSSVSPLVDLHSVYTKYIIYLYTLYSINSVNYQSVCMHYSIIMYIVSTYMVYINHTQSMNWYFLQKNL